MGVDTLLEILLSPDKFYPRMREHYESLITRRNVITAIMVLFREDEELKQRTDIAPEWRRLFDDLTRHMEARIKRSEPDNKQIEKYTSYEEIESKYDDLSKHSPHTTRKKSFQFLMMSILVHLRPKRADLGNVLLFKTNDPNRTDINYIVLRKKGASFIAMNIYKTSKHYQTVEEDLPEGLVRDIIQSVKRWPRRHLFTREDSEPMSNNTYSKFVMNTFEELFGRATGVSLLRHIYISEKLDFDNMTLEEQDNEAKLMLHTSGLQRRYKWPKKVICPKLCANYLPPTKRTRKHPRSLPPKRESKRAELSKRLKGATESD
jgi:hypothetical protein